MKFIHVSLDPASAKQVCAEPILGSFVHETAACKNGTWTSACDTDKSNLNITYQTSTCSPEVYIGYSGKITSFFNHAQV